MLHSTSHISYFCSVLSLLAPAAGGLFGATPAPAAGGLFGAQPTPGMCI